MTTNFLGLFDSAEEQDIISEEEFSSILGPFAARLLSLSWHVTVTAQGEAMKRLPVNFLANLIKHASDVEHLLDRYQARNNRNWIYFRELTATMKNFGKAAFLLEELTTGVPIKHLFSEEGKEFFQKAEQALLFFSNTLTRSLLAIRKEALTFHITIPPQRPPSSYNVKLPKETILPHTIEESGISETFLTARKIAHRVVKLAEDALFLDELMGREGEGLVSQIPENLNEGRLRKLGARVNNLLSWYDSCLYNQKIEFEYPELRTLHQIFSAQLNLSKIGTILTHYIERHLLAPSLVAEELQKIAPVSRLEEEALFFNLCFLARLFHSGKEVAEKLLRLMEEVVIYELPVPRDLGFHARPSTLVTEVVRHYGARVKLLADDQEFDAGSVYDMLAAGGYIVTKGLDLVRFRGDKPVLDDLKRLAAHNYGETREGENILLPEALSYLR